MYAEFSETLEETMANNPRAISTIQASLSDNPSNVPFETALGEYICMLCLQRHKVNEPGNEAEKYVYSCETTLTDELIRDDGLLSRSSTTIYGCGATLNEALTLIAEQCREHKYLLEQVRSILEEFESMPNNNGQIQDIQNSLWNKKSRELSFLDETEGLPHFTLKLSPNLGDLPKSSCRCTLALSTRSNADTSQNISLATVKSELEASAPTVRRTISRVAYMCERQSTNL